MKTRRKPGIKKVTNDLVTPQLLTARAERCMALGFPKQKWVEFCEILLSEGYELSLYEARRTVSKYVTVGRKGAKPFKVRFSNHRPIAQREDAGDCDFFVGIANRTVTTTTQALAAVRAHFKKDQVETDA